METSDIPIRRGDEWPQESGYYVAWRQGAPTPDVIYCNTRDRLWSFLSCRVHVSHYEARKLKERKE